MRFRLASLQVLLALVSLIPLTSMTSGRGPGAGILSSTDKLVAAWEAREKRFRSVDMRWTTRFTIPKGSISANLPRRFKQFTGGETQPPADTSWDSPAEFQLDGNKAHYRYTGQQWDTVENRYYPTEYVSSFSGPWSKELYPNGSGKITHPEGVIQKKGAYNDARNAYLRPVFLFFRPVTPVFLGLDARQLRRVNTMAQVRGFSCIELSASHRGNGMHLWVDPQRDHVIVRQMIVEHNVPSLQADFDYREDQTNGWTPAGWVVTMMDGRGKMYESGAATVTDLQVNPTLAKDIDLVFPTGAVVADNNTNDLWIVRGDGGRRMIARDERKLTYEHLVRSDTGGWLGRMQQRNWFTTCLGVGLALGGIGCLALFVWRRLRKQSHRMTG